MSLKSLLFSWNYLREIVSDIVNNNKEFYIQDYWRENVAMEVREWTNFSETNSGEVDQWVWPTIFAK